MTRGSAARQSASSRASAATITIARQALRYDITDLASLTDPLASGAGVGIEGLANSMAIAFGMRLTQMITALSAGLSQSVGTTTVALSVSTFFDAIYKLQLQSNDGEFAAVLAPQQINHLINSLRSETGPGQYVAATQDQFVPQMVNLELSGGVDFHKGCYPGQEVVARSQYRGTLKRLMFLFECDGAAEPGQEIYHSADPEQPAGMVVNVAARPLPGVTLLAEVKLAALESGTLHLSGAAGPTLRPLPLPYPLPEPVAS